MRALLVLSLLIAVLGSALYQWHRMDTLPPHQDEARHLLAGITCFNDLHRPLRERIHRLTSARFAPHPPLIPLLTIPFYLSGGAGRDTAGLVNVLFLAVMVLSVYGIGRRLYTEPVGLSAAIIAACYPLMVGLSRLCLPEFPEAAMVSLSVYAAIRTGGFRSVSWSVIVGLICGLGMLIEWRFFVFCAAPLAYILLAPGKKLLLSTPLRKRLQNLGCCIGSAAILAAPWYAYRLSSANGLSTQRIVRGISEAAPPLISVSSLLFYPCAFVDTALLLPMTLLFLAGLVVAARHRKASPLLILWIAAPLLVLMLFREKLPRDAAPLLPAAALLTAAGFSLLKTRLLRKTLFAAAFALSALNVALLTLPLPLGEVDICYPLPFSVYECTTSAPLRACMARTALPSCGIGPPRREDWRLKEMMNDVASFGRGAGERKVAIGWIIFPGKRFHRDALRYCVESHEYPFRCVTPDKARFVITRHATEEQELAISSWCRPWLHLEKLKRYPLPDGSEAVLYRSALTRRRRYDAGDPLFGTGGDEVADSETSGGRARHADRDYTLPGPLLKGSLHPLDQGSYRLAVRLKYDRPKGDACPVAIRLTRGKSGETILSRELRADELGRSGSYRPLGFNFQLPERDRLGLQILHTGGADLWIDHLDIIPLDDTRP